MGRTRDVSKILTSNTSILSLASASTTYATKTSTGLNLIIPSTIANTSGTASIGTNGTVSFSSASAISLNDVFSTTYDDYRIIIVASSAVAGTDLTLRVRVSGSDLSTGTYTYNRIIGDGGTLNSARSSAQTSIRCGNTTLSEETSYIIDVVNPFLTKRTVFTINNSNQGGGAAQDMTAAVVTNATSYTGFTILAGNNFTGRLSVYGYNK